MKAIIYFTRLQEDHEKMQEHEAGQALLAYGLEQEYGIAYGKASIANGERGKPYLKDNSHVHFNISHSDCLAVCAFAPVEIGIDVQKHKKVSFVPILERTVPADLAREILDEGEVEPAFFAQWVMREAYIKWTGEGLSKDLRTIDMDRGWHTLLDVDKGYSGAIWSEEPLEVEWRYVPWEECLSLSARLQGRS